MRHSTILYRSADHEFFRLEILTAKPPVDVLALHRERTLTVCFCGQPCAAGSCSTCGYETPERRRYRWASIADGLCSLEDATIGRALALSLDQLDSRPQNSLPS